MSLTASELQEMTELEEGQYTNPLTIDQLARLIDLKIRWRASEPAFISETKTKETAIGQH